MAAAAAVAAATAALAVAVAVAVAAAVAVLTSQPKIHGQGSLYAMLDLCLVQLLPLALQSLHGSDDSWRGFVRRPNLGFGDVLARHDGTKHAS